MAICSFHIIMTFFLLTVCTYLTLFMTVLHEQLLNGNLFISYNYFIWLFSATLYENHVSRTQESELTRLMNGPIRKKLKIIPGNVTWGGKTLCFIFIFQYCHECRSTGYATSRSPLTAQLQLIAQMLAKIAQKVPSANIGVQLYL